MIKAVLFDFGGVLVTSPFTMMGAAGQANGIDADVMLELLMGDYASDNDHPWHRLERGEIPFSEYIDDLRVRAAAAGVPLGGHGIFSDGSGIFEVHEEVITRVRSLRADGIRTAIVTNNIREFGDAWRALIPVDELFDAVIDSSEIGIRKPNPAIYRVALEAVGGVEPGEAVFLDDAEGNVIAARRLGMHAILVREPADALVELDAVLNKVG